MQQVLYSYFGVFSAGGWSDVSLELRLNTVLDAVGAEIPARRLHRALVGKSRLRRRSVCSDLIGRKYSYGRDDCIHLVIDALERMGIKNPGVKEDWYEMTPREVLKELNRYCDRLDRPSYDGDIALLDVGRWPLESYGRVASSTSTH